MFLPAAKAATAVPTSVSAAAPTRRAGLHDLTATCPQGCPPGEGKPRSMATADPDTRRTSDPADSVRPLPGTDRATPSRGQEVERTVTGGAPIGGPPDGAPSTACGAGGQLVPLRVVEADGSTLALVEVSLQGRGRAGTDPRRSRGSTGAESRAGSGRPARVRRAQPVRLRRRRLRRPTTRASPAEGARAADER